MSRWVVVRGKKMNSGNLPRAHLEFIFQKPILIPAVLQHKEWRRGTAVIKVRFFDV